MTLVKTIRMPVAALSLTMLSAGFAYAHGSAVSTGSTDIYGTNFQKTFADSDASISTSKQAAADGSVQWSGGAVAAGIGYTWGDGSLAFRGEKHDFTVSGVSIVDVGATSMSVSGDVYHLNNLSDFSGNYFALSAGGTLAGGGSVVYLQNEHGVVIKVSATEVGLRFSLAAGGLSVALKS